MAEVVVDEPQPEEDHDQTKPGRRPVLAEDHPLDESEARPQEPEVRRVPDHRRGNPRERRERYEEERHDRRVEIPVRIVEPVDRLARDEPLRGDVVDLEVRHAAGRHDPAMHGDRDHDRDERKARTQKLVEPSCDTQQRAGSPFHRRSRLPLHSRGD